MTLLEFAIRQGLDPKRKASTRGGEYSSPCPSCGGENRLILQPNLNEGKGFYWCRQCGIKGDAIQFGREFLGYSFQVAAELVGLRLTPRRNCSSVASSPVQKNEQFVHQKWTDKALKFVQYTQSRLFLSPEGLGELSRRGLTESTARTWSLGFNGIERFDNRFDWGLEEQLNQNGNPKKVWLPRGIVIPLLIDHAVIKVRIRCLQLSKGEQKKYIVLSGSRQCYAWYGQYDPAIPVVLVESDLDAILLWQEAGDLCLPVALGSAQARPDALSDARLKKARCILYALDWDDAGKKEFAYWRRYPSVIPWPASKGKSIGDDFIAGANLRQWLLYKINLNGGVNGCQSSL